MKKLVALVLCSVCFSCSDNSTDKPREAVNIHGSVAMGEIQTGVVSLYDFGACSRGKQLAQAHVLDQEAGFNFSIGATGAATPVLIELSQYTYIEQWSGETVDASDKVLYGVYVIDAGEREVDVVVSFWTHMASALAMQKCDLNSSIASSHVEAANKIFNDALTIDIHRDTPVYFDDFESPDFSIRELAGARYGIANSAVASYTYNLDKYNSEATHHISYTSAMFTDTAFSDLRFEGFLNGVNADGQMQLGVVELKADVYRTAIPLHMDSIIDNLRNLPEGIDSTFLVGIVSKVHESSDSGLYGFSQPQDLTDKTPPELVEISISNCGTPIVGSCCGGTFRDDENVYGSSATLEYSVIDTESSYDVSVLHVGTTENAVGYNVEYIRELNANVTNSTIPWRSGQKVSIAFRQDSTNFFIPNVTAVFTNKYGQALSVTRTINAGSCTFN